MRDYLQGIVVGAVILGFPIGLALGHHWFCTTCKPTPTEPAP